MADGSELLARIRVMRDKLDEVEAAELANGGCDVPAVRAMTRLDLNREDRTCCRVTGSTSGAVGELRRKREAGDYFADTFTVCLVMGIAKPVATSSSGLHGAFKTPTNPVAQFSCCKATKEQAKERSRLR